MRLTVNGKEREVAVTASPTTLDHVVAALDMHGGRVAIEHGGEIVPRSTWPTRVVSEGDKLEVVHFVGGGKDSQPNGFRSTLAKEYV